MDHFLFPNRITFLLRIGLSSVSGFGQPAETVDNLEFKDNYSPDQQQQQDMVGYSYSQGGKFVFILKAERNDF